MLYLFGFVDSPTAPVDLPAGALGRPEIVELTAGRSAVVSELAVDPSIWDDPSAERTAEAVLHHDAVLTACLEHTVAPARFGTLLADRTALERVDAVHGGDLDVALARLRGRHEYELRLPVARPAAATGGDYLRRRRDELAGASSDPLLVEVREIVSEMVERSVARDQRRVAVLADEREIGALRRRLDGVEGADVRGPYPPYTFSGSIGSADA